MAKKRRLFATHSGRPRGYWGRCPEGLVETTGTAGVGAETGSVHGGLHQSDGSDSNSATSQAETSQPLES